MYRLTIRAITRPSHPDHATVHEAYVACWIEDDSPDAAIETAVGMIEEEPWDVVEVVDHLWVDEADYPHGDEERRYYKQALVDKEVLVFHCCPRFTLYTIEFALQVQPESHEPYAVQVWVLNELVDEQYDTFSADFWSGPRVERAMDLAREAVADAGHVIERVIREGKCSVDEDSEDYQYQDDAEEFGICILWIKEPHLRLVTDDDDPG